MRVLLDESVPRRLGFLLEGHYVRTVQRCGWSGLKNGDLLRTAQAHFDVLVTADKNMQYQQNPRQLPIPVVMLSAGNNRLESFQPLVPELLAVLADVKPGEFRCVGGSLRVE
jgi:predicted nuclease of predicted toxin-antitoxin system